MSEFEPLTGYNVYEEGSAQLEVYEGHVELSFTDRDDQIWSSVFIKEETFLKLVDKYLEDRELLDDFGL